MICTFFYTNYFLSLLTQQHLAITILACLIIHPASSQKATKVTKATYQKAAVMSYPSAEGFKVFPSVKGKALFTKASKGRRQLTVSSKGVNGSIGAAALSVPYIKGKAGKGKGGKSGGIPLKEAGLSIPSIEKEFRIFHHKHAKSGKETAVGLPSSSPSVSSVPSASPSDVPSSSSAPSDKPSLQPSESPVPTTSAKARKLESESKSAKASSSSDDYRRGRVMY